MKHKSLIALSLLPFLIVSCADQVGGEDYDVANPYAAPDYGDTAGAPNLPSDVNPAYDQAAVYEDTTLAVPEPAVPASRAQARVHTVVRGDSLWSIGKKYGVSIDAIKQANAMTRDTAVLGAKLKIPAQ
jgi:LysM repeat protein